jgi:hypothetical protein
MRPLMHYLAFDASGQIAFEGFPEVEPAVPDAHRLVAAMRPPSFAGVTR